jgi:hypothetical protein
MNPDAIIDVRLNEKPFEIVWYTSKSPPGNMVVSDGLHDKMGLRSCSLNDSTLIVHSVAKDRPTDMGAMPLGVISEPRAAPRVQILDPTSESRVV